MNVDHQEAGIQPKRDPEPKPFVILSLQGGGALGMFQVGVVEELTKRGYDPDWICGISIGAINSPIIAGNTHENRSRRLRLFWDKIRRRNDLRSFIAGADGFMGDAWQASLWGFLMSSMFGQPNFFRPWPTLPWFSTPWIRTKDVARVTSFYDTSPLRQILEECIDFDLLNSAAAPRLSLGATHVSGGQLTFFDNKDVPNLPGGRITTDHIRASGALPPAFAAVAVGDKLYWDGGVSANTPLEAVTKEAMEAILQTRDVVIFVVNLWNPYGPPPANMAEVMWRSKEIQYANRVSRDAYAFQHKMADGGIPINHTVTLVEVLYRSSSMDRPFGDGDFSDSALERRYQEGLAEAARILDTRVWEQETFTEIRTHDQRATSPYAAPAEFYEAPRPGATRGRKNVKLSGFVRRDHESR